MSPSRLFADHLRLRVEWDEVVVSGLGAFVDKWFRDVGFPAVSMQIYPQSVLSNRFSP